MLKRKLTISSSDICCWNKTLQRMLVDSNLFNVSEEKFPVYKLSIRRSYNLSFIKVDNKLIAIDTWDALHPLTMIENIIDDPFLSQVKIALKIQYKKSKKELFSNFENKTGIKVSSWTMFPSSVFPLGNFQWNDIKHEYVAFITGKRRRRWFKAAKNNSSIYTPSNGFYDKGIESYIEIMKKSKWGLILAGKSSGIDVKNRREVEFSSCGMPLVLNYVPEYDFEFRPNYEYILIKNFDDLEGLTNFDARQFSEASRRVYDNYFSPNGMAKHLIEIVDRI